MILKNIISIYKFNYHPPLCVIFLLLYSLSSHAEYQHSGYAPWVGTTLTDLRCEGGPQAYGPFDYTNPSHNSKRPVVEEHHFNKNVEYLIKGQTDHVVNDLDFTLRAFPNHHKALLSVIRYQFKLNDKLVKKSLPTPAECYLKRAINFSPKDTTSYALYAYYLRKIDHLTEAEKVYKKALQASPDTSKIEYSYSLLLIDLKKYDQALIYAKKAYQHGHPPQSLKNKLIKLKVWE